MQIKRMNVSANLRGIKMKCVKYHLTNESIRYNAIQYLRTCDLDIIVEFKQRNRSLDQNRKLWSCLGDVSR